MSGLEPGTTLGGYSILAKIRAGSMGVLYLARRQGPKGFQRPVAIKVIHDHLAADKRFCKLFIDEAKLSAQIDDPNVVRVEEFGRSEDGRYYLVMEYVDGLSLKDMLARLEPFGGLTIEVAVAIASRIAAGLHGAHEAVGEDGASLGIVHRDVSPHNVLVSYRGHVRVIDFGIAKARQSSGQTRTGSLRGKLSYMPPEQARSARDVDRRADLYSLGIVLWEMLARRKLFEADSDIAILNMIRNPTIVAPSALRPEVPPALDRVVLQMLAQDPAQRPATGADVERLLGHALPAALHVRPDDLATLMERAKELAPSAPPSSRRRGDRRDERRGERRDEETAPAPPPPVSGETTAPSSPKDLPPAIDGIDDEPTTAVPETPVRIPPPPRPGEATRLSHPPLAPAPMAMPMAPLSSPPHPPPLAPPPFPLASESEADLPVAPVLRKIEERRKRKVELAVLLLVIVIAVPLTYVIMTAR